MRLPPLKGLSNLRSLDVEGTKVTEKGLKTLRAALPELDSDR
jgi:hypothetical protein